MDDTNVASLALFDVGLFVDRRRACPGGETLVHYDDAAHPPFCADPPPCRHRRQGGGSAETTISESGARSAKTRVRRGEPGGDGKKEPTPKHASEGKSACLRFGLVWAN